MTDFELLLYIFLFCTAFVSFLIGFYQIWRAKQDMGLGDGT